MIVSKRVVVTGIGIITSLGHNIDTYWNNLLIGKSGINVVTRFDASPYASKIASEVKNFDASQYMSKKALKRNDRYTQFAVAATKLALEDASIDIGSINQERVGVFIASGIGGMETIEKQSRTLFEKGPRRVSPFMIPSLISNIASGVVAIEVGAMGPNYGIVSACASGAHAIGEAMKYIQMGDVDMMIVGGSEAAVTALGYSGFCAMKAMSTSFNNTPKQASRPFDKNRDGFVMGEGAGILILENLEHAESRGKKIYCEIAGYEATCDAYHITSPHPEGKGLSLCLKKILKKAKIAPKEVDYINAHGTSTQYNDKFETLAIKNIWGKYANELVISSTKSMTGHLLGAAGAIEAAAAIKTIQTGQMPPTINYQTPDEECNLDCIANKSRKKNVRIALSNNLGFGGQNACLLFKKF